MITALVRSRDIQRCSASQATPAKPPLSSSTVPLISIGAACVTPARRIAAAANTAAARPAFMSHEPRPYNRPSIDLAAKRIARPAETDRHHVEVTVQMNRRTGGRSVVPADDVDAGMLGGVLDAADRRQQLHLGAMRAQLVTNHAGACFVVGAGRIDRGNANQA